MSKFVCALVVIILTCQFLLAQSTTISSGKVKGIVYDSSREAIILEIEVSIEGKEIKRSVHPNSESGEYEFDVPSGIYNITTKEGIWHSIKRASFRVEAGKTTTINLYPAIRIVSTFLTLDGDKTTYGSIPKYDLLNIDDASLDIIIQVKEQKSDSGIIEYKYAALTFDNQTILADLIRFNKKSKTVELEGNILIDDNGQRSKTNKSGIEFLNGRLKIKPQK